MCEGRGQIQVEMHFEPVLDLYSVWWDGERVVHRRSHGITDEEVVDITLNAAMATFFDILADSLKVEVDPVVAQWLER